MSYYIFYYLSYLHMHLKLFLKNLFFCVIVLLISIHATSSIAESSDRLQKTASVLSLFVKAVVMGLAFGSQIQVLASPFSQKSKHSLDKRQEQQDSNVCVSNSDDIFYVGQNNLTRCLEQNPRGTFIFVERVNFTQFSENEKEKYPLYNHSVPFSGSLTMFPYSFDHFNISRDGSAAMFCCLENATIRANLTYPDVTCGSGLFIASSIVNSLSGHNTLEVELDSASIKSGISSFSGGVVGILLKNSINDISVIVKNYLNVSGSSGGGGVLYDIGANSILNLNAIIETLFVECTVFGFYGGVIGIVRMGVHAKVSVKGSLISITKRFDDFLDTSLGALYGTVNNVNQLYNINIQVDNVTIDGSKNSIGGVVYGTFSQPEFNVNQQATLIRGMHVNIQADTSNAIGSGSVNSGEKFASIYLLSINGTLGSPNHILAPQGVSCEGSIIDWSGVHLNTTNLGCTGTLELETLRPEHWREAHRLVAVELCKDQKNCFYVHEDLLALVKERDNSFFLVTRQRYPYNNANDGQGVVRVIQYILNNPQYDPTINTAFAINGTRLFTNATERLLPVERPLSTSLTDDHQLLMLYGETANLKVASMPLMGIDDATYTIHTVQSSAAPVQIDKDTLWLNQDGNLLAYKVFDASTEIFSRNTTLPRTVNLIGAQRYQDYVYTAQPENDTHIFMARFFNDGRQDAHWTSSLSFAYDDTYHQLQISGDDNEPIISFPHVAELYQHNLSNRSYVTIELPSRGGIGEWRYNNESFIQTLLPEPPTLSTTDVMGNMTTAKTIIPVDIMNSTDGNPNDNGGNGGTIAAGILVPIFLIGSSTAVAVVTVIVCHKKKVPCFVNLEKKFMPHLKHVMSVVKKTEASDL